MICFFTHTIYANSTYKKKVDKRMVTNLKQNQNLLSFLYKSGYFSLYKTFISENSEESTMNKLLN